MVPCHDLGGERISPTFLAEASSIFFGGGGSCLGDAIFDQRKSQFIGQLLTRNRPIWAIWAMLAKAVRIRIIAGSDWHLHRQTLKIGPGDSNSTSGNDELIGHNLTQTPPSFANSTKLGRRRPDLWA